MSEQPSVSVVINNYNYGRFLRQCVETALRQTVECEIVVVDDGSTDESRDVLAAFGRRIAVIAQENKGQAAAMNAGVRQSSGDVIAFLDSDDYMFPERIELVRAAFAEDGSTDWIRHDMTSVDEGGRTVSESLYAVSSTGAPFRDVLAFGDTWGATSGLAFSRSCLQRMGPIPEDVYRFAAADGYLLVVGALTGRGRTLPRSLCARRQHPGQVTKRTKATRSQIRHFIGLRTHIASTAAGLAPHGPEAADLRAGATWWQRKAALQAARLARAPIAGRLELWRGYVRSLSKSQLSASEKVGFAVRDTALAIVPQSTFETLWWVTHDGRPVLRSRGSRASA